MTNTIKIILSILLLTALAHMPYGYYTFLRLAATAGLIYLAIAEFKANNNAIAGILCIAGALLFNPIIKVPFHRAIWNAIDAATAVLLIIWAIINLKKK